MKKENEIVLFETNDGDVKLSVPIQEDTVWLTQSQMVELFDRDQSVVSRHINNSFVEELDKESNMHFLHIANSDKPVAYYSLRDRDSSCPRSKTSISHETCGCAVCQKSTCELLGRAVIIL